MYITNKKHILLQRVFQFRMLRELSEDSCRERLLRLQTIINYRSAAKDRHEIAKIQAERSRTLRNYKYRNPTKFVELFCTCSAESREERRAVSIIVGVPGEVRLLRSFRRFLLLCRQ